MTKRKLRKNADISPPQSPHDGIHTCSKGCKKPGCSRTLRDTIEEQDQQIEALKQDVLEKTTENARLKADVERLTKAGDALAELVEPPYEYMKQDEYPLWAAEIDLMKRWNAAKKGVQS
jgi:hypothetical protein